MGLGLTIRANGSQELGSAQDVTMLLARYFTGYKPSVELNRAASPPTGSFLRSLLPRGLKWELTGPTSEKINVAHVEEDGYVIEFQYDEASEVPALYLTLYGQTANADQKLAKLCGELGWTKKY